MEKTFSEHVNFLISSNDLEHRNPAVQSPQEIDLSHLMIHFSKFMNLAAHEIKVSPLSTAYTLSSSVAAYTSCTYTGYRNPNNPQFINILKNDTNDRPRNLQHEGKTYSNFQIALSIAYKLYSEIALPGIMRDKGWTEAVVCHVPRAKCFKHYTRKQLHLFDALRWAIEEVNISTSYKIEDGIDYLWRRGNRPTSHAHTANSPDENWLFFLDRESMVIDPNLSYEDSLGIDTEALQGKKVILVDDIYTYRVGIDEMTISEISRRAGVPLSDIVLYTLAYTGRSLDTMRLIHPIEQQ